MLATSIVQGASIGSRLVIGIMDFQSVNWTLEIVNKNFRFHVKEFNDLAMRLVVYGQEDPIGTDVHTSHGVGIAINILELSRFEIPPTK